MTPMTDERLQQLREFAYSHDIGPTMNEVVTEITRLRAELDGCGAANRELTADLAVAKHELAECRIVTTVIEKLVEDEGSSVHILCPNPDFNGLPNRAIEVCGDWTEWQLRRFGADKLVDCLSAAHIAYEAAKGKE